MPDDGFHRRRYLKGKIDPKAHIEAGRQMKIGLSEPTCCRKFQTTSSWAGSDSRLEFRTLIASNHRGEGPTDAPGESKRKGIQQRAIYYLVIRG